MSEALALPKRKRTELALQILESVDPPDPQAGLTDDEWVAEIERRARRAASGKSRGSSWEVARARIQRRLRS